MAWTLFPSRRQLLVGLAATPTAAWASLPASSSDRARPIAEVGGPAEGWLGDDPEGAHGHLWSIDGALEAPLPAAVETDVVVVGGGVSGLAIAWRLRDRSPVVLEAQSRFGGNARGERRRGLETSLGAAYFAFAPPGSLLREQFYGPLGLDRAWRLSEGGGFVWEGALHEDFWRGTTDPSARSAFRAVEHFLRRTSRVAYPDLPPGEWQVLTEGELADLDRRSLLEVLEQGTGAPLHPHVRAFLELYCRSAFGGGADEISAASGLNFLCAELESIAVLPGGNAQVAERLHDGLRGLPEGHLRAGTAVLRVRPEGGRVEVVARDALGLRVWSARAVVMACPKFVAARVCPTMPTAQREAVSRLRYRAYTVANVWCRRPTTAGDYDLYLLRDPVPAAGTGPTDLVLGQWAAGDTERSVLTFYRPLPTDGGRAEVLDPASVERFRSEARAAAAEVLPLLGLAEADVEEVRMSRFGHALPLAEKGRIADGTLTAARAPLDGGVWFVHQDDWALPALETCLVRALEVEPAVRARLA